MVKESFETVQALFEPYGGKIKKILENRIDYCYHTNAIQNMEKEFFDEKLKKYMTTNLAWLRKEIELKKEDGSLYLNPTYLLIGSPKSNNVAARIYDKTLEVVELGYKGYFFDLWHDCGMISYYDKYCLSKAYLEKNYNKVYYAKLEPVQNL